MITPTVHLVLLFQVVSFQSINQGGTINDNVDETNDLMSILSSGLIKPDHCLGFVCNTCYLHNHQTSRAGVPPRPSTRASTQTMHRIVCASY